MVSALVDKRAELAGEIEGLERQADQLRAGLLHIDSAIRIFAPEYRPNEIRPKAKRKKGEWFAQGEMMRLVLETLRKASDPLTAKEIALALMGHKGFEISDERTVRLVEKRAFSVLRGARAAWSRRWCMGRDREDGRCDRKADRGASGLALVD